MPSLSLSLFGTFQIASNDTPVTAIESDKGRALLAYLAVEAGRPHRRATLAALLWPDADRRTARQNLRRALYNLRQAIESDDLASPFFLVSRQDIEFSAHSACRLDVEAFTARLDACQAHAHHRLDDCADCMARLEQAVALYRGDFLAGFSLPDAEPFEEWRLFKQEELHRRAIGALGHLAAYHERRREYEAAGHPLRRQIELEPWREEAHRRLMRVLARSGQRSAALRQYEVCRRSLVEEFGVEPAVETTRLYGRIQTGELEPAVFGDRSARQHFEDVLLSTHADLALVALAGNDAEYALANVQVALERLKADDALALRERVHYAAYRVLLAQGDRGPALDHLRQAEAAMLDLAGTLPPDARERFLQQDQLNGKVRAALDTLTRRVRISLVRQDVPLGRRLTEEDHTEVIWTIYTVEDDGIPEEAERRRHVLQRLLAEAEAQDAVPTDDDLAGALSVSRRTIRRDMGVLTAAGVALPTRRRSR